MKFLIKRENNIQYLRVVCNIQEIEMNSDIINQFLCDAYLACIGVQTLNLSVNNVADWNYICKNNLQFPTMNVLSINFDETFYTDEPISIPTSFFKQMPTLFGCILNLANNQLNGLSEALSACSSKIFSLELQNVSLVRYIAFSQLKTISVLTINDTYMETLPMEISLMPKLTSLHLSNNGLMELPKWFESSEIKILGVSENALQKIFVPRNVTHLRLISCFNTITGNLTQSTLDKIFYILNTAKNLQNLNLDGNALKHWPIINHYPKNLESIILSKNPFITLPILPSCVTHFCFKDLHPSTKLCPLPVSVKRVMLTYTDKFCGNGEQAINTLFEYSHYDNLKSLGICGCNLYTLPTCLRKMPNLKTLDTHDNWIEEYTNIPKGVKNLFISLPVQYNFGFSKPNIKKLHISRTHEDESNVEGQFLPASILCLQSLDVVKCIRNYYNEDKLSRVEDNNATITDYIWFWHSLCNRNFNEYCFTNTRTNGKLFCKWCNSMYNSADFISNPELLANMICDIISHLIQNDEFITLFHTLVETAEDSCTDRHAMILNELYTHTQLNGIQCNYNGACTLAQVARKLCLRQYITEWCNKYVDHSECTQIFLFMESVLNGVLHLGIGTHSLFNKKFTFTLRLPTLAECYYAVSRMVRNKWVSLMTQYKFVDSKIITECMHHLMELQFNDHHINDTQYLERVNMVVGMKDALCFDHCNTLYPQAFKALPHFSLSALSCVL